MGEATGTLDIVRTGVKQTLTWNGHEPDRQAARAAFEELMRSGSYLATVADGPRTGHQVRTFDEVEQVEKERGVVSVQISHAIVGG